MPVFEYRCRSCGKSFSQLVGMTSDTSLDPCPHCGSQESDKKVSRFRRGRNEDARIDEMADRLEIMGEPDSPAEIRSIVREMGKAMDEDLADEMEEMFEADMDGEEGADD